MSKRSASSAPTRRPNWTNAAGEQIASFSSLDARLERAQKHLDDLHVEIARLFAAHVNPEFFVCYNDDSQPGKRRIDIVNTANTTTVSLIASDAVHNIRSALNYLYFNLAVFYGTVEPFKDKELKGIQFRAPKTAKAYKAAIRGEVKRFRKDVAKMLRALYSNGRMRRTLWRLNHISNKDKHCALLGIGVKGEGWRSLKQEAPPPISPTSDEGSTETIKAALALPFPLKNHTIIARIPNANAGDEMQVSFQIALNQPGIIVGEPVIETLDDMFDLASTIIESFRPYFRP